MNPALSTPSRRIGIAIAFSLLLHALMMWGPRVELPKFKTVLPPLVAKLQAIPTAPANPRPKVKRLAKTAPPPLPAPVVEKVAAADPTEEIPLAASAPVATEAAASAVVAAATLAEKPPEILIEPPVVKAVERPLLPRRAQLTFAVNKGISDFKVGESIHTLEIEDGHYVLQAVTKTVGLAKLFKTFQLTQYSSGSYTPQLGIQPERFFEERTETTGALRNTVEFDYATQRAHFSHGGEIAFPADTQDILSILYQFPPVHGVDSVAIYVSNGKKIESYHFEVSYEEATPTPLGNLHTVHLSKLHSAQEEGLEIWLAQEFRLFPVKMRIIEKNGEITGEILITDIRVEDTP